VEPYKARKVGGSYQATGHILSEFKTLAGKPMVAFEFSAYPGMIHLFSVEQVKRMENEAPSCFRCEPTKAQRAEYNCVDCNFKYECLGVV
jgi:hypothetical protein